MPNVVKDDEDKASEGGPVGETAVDKETVGDALSKVGFKPAKVGRRIVSQGRPRQALKRKTSEEPDR
jgi:hypothetical protein